MLLRLAVGIVCFAAFLPGQEGESDVRSAEGERRAKKAAAGEAQEEKGEIDDSRMTPEQRLARNITSGASAYCKLLATVTPAKLMPGQSGTLKILATLQGHAVIPSPAPLEMLAQPQQGAVSLGGLAIRPADVGRLEKGYVGRPVYENYAVFEVPVTMAATAVLGSKHAVAVDLKFDLYDGASAQPIGRFLDRVGTEIEVGAVPDPQVKGGVARPAAAVADVGKPLVAPPAEAAPPGPATNPVPLAANAVVPEPTKVPSQAPESPAAAGPVLPVEDDGAGMPLPLLVGGGVLLLGVALLLARKK